MEEQIPKILITRHGETDRFSDQIIGSGSDIPLNRRGILQALELSRIIKEGLNPLKVIISSPLRRAIMTSTIIADALGTVTRIELDEDIQAQNFGILEGARVSEAVNDPRLSPFLWGNMPKEERYFSRPDNGESLEDINYRVFRWFSRYGKNPHQNSLIVTHGSVIRTLYGQINRLHPTLWEHLQIGNTQIYNLENNLYSINPFNINER